MEQGRLEASRLAALEQYDVLDTPSEAGFERIAEATALILDAPIAIIGFLTGSRHWFKAAFGTVEAASRQGRGHSQLCGRAAHHGRWRAHWHAVHIRHANQVITRANRKNIAARVGRLDDATFRSANLRLESG